MSFTTGEIVEIAVRGLWLGQQWQNVWQYRIGVPGGLGTASDLGEAWWNHVKIDYRALAPTTASVAFSSVLVKSLDDAAGEYGEFAVPSGEQTGTRSITGLAQELPSYVGVGVRLAVSTRVTHPGQKRFTFQFESDTFQNEVQAPITALITTLMDTMVADMVLGAPALLTELEPVVVRKTGAGLAAFNQAITGYAISPISTTQVSRKQGRGN